MWINMRVFLSHAMCSRRGLLVHVILISWICVFLTSSIPTLIRSVVVKGQRPNRAYLLHHSSLTYNNVHKLDPMVHIIYVSWNSGFPYLLAHISFVANGWCLISTHWHWVSPHRGQSDISKFIKLNGAHVVELWWNKVLPPDPRCWDLLYFVYHTNTLFLS